MRKRPSSSQKRKPLLFASLAASLTLHVGAVYFLLSHPFSFLNAFSSEKHDQTLVQAIEPELEVEFALKETLDRLILREATAKAPSTDQPYLEMTEPKLKILSNFAYSPSISSATTPPSFHFEDPSYTISESEEYTRLKPQPFGPKKWINFSQSLEVEMSHLTAADEPQEEKAIPYRQPKLEQENQLAQIQDIGKLPVEVPETSTEALFAFHIEEKTVSEMINSELEVTKQKSKNTQQIEKPLPLSPLASNAQELKKKTSTPFDPSLQQTTKKGFDRESFYFFFDEKLKNSSLPELNTSLSLSAPLFKTPYSPSKKLLEASTQPSFAFFQNIAPLDLTPLKENQTLFAPMPCAEEVSRLTMPQTKSLPKMGPVDSPHPKLDFEQPEVLPPANLSQKALNPPRIPLNKTISQTFPSQLPEVPEEKLAALSQSRKFQPKKEHAKLLELPQKSTFHRNQQVLTSQASLPFDLALDSVTLAAPHVSPPKHSPVPLSSAIAIPKLGFGSQVQSEKAIATEVTPKRESVDPSASPLSYPTPKLQLPKCEPALTPTLTPQAAFFPEYLAQSIDFPHAPLAFKSSDLTSIDMPEFTPDTDIRIAVKQVEPKQEDVKALEHQSTFALDLAEIDSKEKRLYAPDDVDNLPLSPSHTVRPKHSLSKHSSTLALQKKPSMTEQQIYDNKALAKAIKPKEEPVAISLDKTPAKHLVDPSLPLHLLKRRPGYKIALDLNQTPLAITPHIAHAPPVKTFPKMTPSVSPLTVEKHIRLSSPELEQTVALKTTPPPEPKRELATATLPKREDISLKISKSRPTKEPNLDLEEVELDIKSDALTLVKKELQTDEPLAMPTLPYLKEKRVASSKVPFKPTKALTELPSPETFLALVPRAEAYPNTKRLLSKHPIPHREPQKNVQTSYTLAREIKEPETDDIQSQAKQLLEKHYNESLAQNSSVNMANPKIKKPLSEQDYHTINETHRFTQGYLSEIPATANLDTISFQNDFETTVTYVKKPDGSGYQFALKIKPNEKLYFGSPEQNFIFIVDGSGTIKKHRYNTFKDAVVKSLAYMQDGDSFNILVADSQIAVMSDKPMTWSKQGIRKVRSYLKSRTYRGYFSNYDAFDLLSKASQYFDPNKENIVILITDGHSLETISKHKEALKTLAANNKGHFSLFTASASQGNNIAMLDLISTFNNGEFMYSQTNAAFPRKLAVLVKHIESLIAKDIRVHITSADPNLDVQFYPNQESYPLLYADQPYTLYGSIDKLEDFELILQGRSGDSWINIKQKVSFYAAEEAGYKLKRNFALQQAYVCYDYYLKQNDPFFLSEAERILSPHAVSPATQ